MTLNLTEDRPIYIQIKEYIEGEILTGNLTADEQIPSTHQLVSFFNINPVTVLKGIGLLTDEGIVYKKRGVGMFVSADARELLRRKHREVFAADMIMPMVRRGKALGLSVKELQKLVEQVWEEV
ncbi:GntR family transcriptional regulator [Spirochaetia bacterium]|nr:GntR family transcriptional regulator [Spirochaetia bacterium]